MKLYDSAGWVNAAEILQDESAFKFITGGRGIGKTYSFIKWFLDNRKPFILMRRTQVEAELQADPITSSLTKNLSDMGRSFRKETIAKKLTRLIDNDTGEEICICCALSTLASVRGVDLSRYDYLLYDEFIPEPHVKAIKMEGLALFNAYESINRNREITEGRQPLQLLGLSNSLNLANDVFMQFNLVDAAEGMIQQGLEEYRRGNILLLILQNSPISEQKKGTALYAAASEEYAKMAIENKFILNDFTYVKKRKLNEYKPAWSVGDLTIYEHKSRQEYYVTFSGAVLPRECRYGSNYMDLQKVKRDKWNFYLDYLDGFVMFDSYKAVALFEKYFR